MQFEFSMVHLSYISDTLMLFALTKWPSGDPLAKLLEILMSERVPYLLSPKHTMLAKRSLTILYMQHASVHQFRQNQFNFRDWSPL